MAGIWNFFAASYYQGALDGSSTLLTTLLIAWLTMEKISLILSLTGCRVKLFTSTSSWVNAKRVLILQDTSNDNCLITSVASSWCELLMLHKAKSNVPVLQHQNLQLSCWATQNDWRPSVCYLEGESRCCGAMHTGGKNRCLVSSWCPRNYIGLIPSPTKVASQHVKIKMLIWGGISREWI